MQAGHTETDMENVREICVADSPERLRYSVCTLVTRPDEYGVMRDSFRDAGFTDDLCEFLYTDNSTQNQCDAFAAMNVFLQEAAGEYIILCHQDIRLHDHTVTQLDTVITDLSQRAPNWGVIGNAGGIRPGHLAVRITDPKGTNTADGPFPAQVAAIDENFMLVRRSANLCLSGDLSGFHFYGTDLCIIADILGFSSWVVDFHLHHIGGASTDKKGKSEFHTSYFDVRESLIRKYRRAFRSRWIQNTGTIIYLTGSRLKQIVLNSKPAVRLCKLAGKIKRRLSQGG